MLAAIFTLVIGALPFLAAAFVGLLAMFKGYIKIRWVPSPRQPPPPALTHLPPPRCRSNFGIAVNCWFCNENSRVPYLERNCWTCPHCEQYNGFTRDGDYNRDLPAQRDTSQHSEKSHPRGSPGTGTGYNYYYADAPVPSLANGLCDNCNESQRLKVEKLAQFEPLNESRFDQELKVYSKQLEEQFRLCSSCERHVNKVLHEKKKMVLGSKFLNFLMKGAALLKEPHFHRLATAQRLRRLRNYRLVMKLLTLANIVFLFCCLPVVTAEQFEELFGYVLGTALFHAYSHFLALIRVMVELVSHGLDRSSTVDKMLMYGRTFGKLVLYSIGLSLPQVQQATLATCYTNMYPYAMLLLSFLYKISDGLKFTRYTVILLLWSAYGKWTDFGGFSLFLLGSVVTCLLLLTDRSNPLSQSNFDESAGDSFHRLCADECISDEETLSMLSQQLSGCGSPARVNNNSSNLSHLTPSGCMTPMPPSVASPAMSPRGMPPAPASVLSLDSLHVSNRLLRAAPSFPQQHQQQLQSESVAMPAKQVEPWYRSSGHSTFGQTRAYARSTQNLLTPSRLVGNRNTGVGGDVCAWVAASQSMNQNLGTAHLMRQYEEKEQPYLSRTSSQSSGFESQ
ncbi:hypothetical protein KR018_012597, partial [Drosophila ironensis]